MPFSTLSSLTTLRDKCQMKSFEEINILIKAILRFCICTTNKLFDYFILRYIDIQYIRVLQPPHKFENFVVATST